MYLAFVNISRRRNFLTWRRVLVAVSIAALIGLPAFAQKTNPGKLDWGIKDQYRIKGISGSPSLQTGKSCFSSFRRNPETFASLPAFWTIPLGGGRQSRSRVHGFGLKPEWSPDGRGSLILLPARGSASGS
jgi:hypothetical protein